MKKRVLADESQRTNAPVERINAYIAILKQMVDCKTVYTKNGEKPLTKACLTFIISMKW